MDSFSNPAVIWFIIGFVLLVLELLVPGLILLFFAAGAWLVALFSLSFDLSLNTQLVIFIVSSVVFVLIFRKWVKTLLWTGKRSSELIENEFLGKTGKAATAIRPGQNGKVDFKGTVWDASSDDIIEQGENVTIIGNESILLIVKSTKTL